MKKIVLLMTVLSSFAFATEYLCQNINYQIVDGSLNGQPLYIKMTFTADSYDQDAVIELFDRYHNPNTDDGLVRNCHDHPNMSRDKRNLICMDSDVFSSMDARAFMDFKIDSYSGELRETFLAKFYDTDASSTQYNFRIYKDSLRQFYCKKIEANNQ